jgi:hypothetical protein
MCTEGDAGSRERSVLAMSGIAVGPRRQVKYAMVIHRRQCFLTEYVQMDHRFAISVLLIAFLCIGCSALFAPQELSENYALSPGVECDAPLAVDGDMETVSSNTRIVISLPERKSIRKIIVYSTNISDFILYESAGAEGQWKIIKGVRGNKLPKVVINTQVTTDKIRMFVSDTRGSRFADPGTVMAEDGFPSLFSRQVDALPQIKEIELYGLVDKIKTDEPLF